MAARWTAVFAVMLAAIGTAGAQGSGAGLRQDDTAGDGRAARPLQPVLAGRAQDLVVDELPGHAAGAGLTGDAIREAVEGRLWRARLLDPNAEPLVHVEIVLGEPEGEHIPFYSVELRYLRDLVAERIGLAALAETWSAGGAGQGDAASFLDHLGTFVDAFIAEYRRVRDSEACREAGRPRPPTPNSQSGG